MVCERSFLAALDGSCRTPIAGWARNEGGQLAFTGMVATVDGKKTYQTTRAGSLTGAQAGRQLYGRLPYRARGRGGGGGGGGTMKCLAGGVGRGIPERGARRLQGVLPLHSWRFPAYPLGTNA